MDELEEIKKSQVEEVMLNPNILVYGQYITPEQRISLYSADQYEDFIHSWAYLVVKKQYANVLKVKKLGGPGDYGRDVVAVLDKRGKTWDNYQCKHYDHPLVPSDIWKELGKLFYHTKEGNITLPRAYYFVAPHGIGKTLNDLLDDPDELKRLFLESWDKHCSKSITKGKQIELTRELKKCIEDTDFSIFNALSPTEVVEQYRETSDFIPRFGGGMPNRPVTPEPTKSDYDIQRLYIQRLLEAYSDYLGQEIKTLEELEKHPNLYKHLHRQVRYFFSTESLKALVRDNLGSAADELENEVYDGIIDELELSTENGYIKVNQAIKTAASLPLHGNALRDAIKTGDKKGACHHLAEAGRVNWSKNNS
jgi:hypothetical protein